MSRHRIEDVLQDLGDPRPAPTQPIIDFITAWNDRKAQKEALQHSEIESAFADGLAEGERRAQVEREALMRLCEARTAEQISAARNAWSAEHGQGLAAAIAQQVAGLSDTLSALIADVLEPMLAARAHRACLTELTQTVRAIIDVKGAATIVVKGRDDVMQAVGASLEAAGIAHELVQAASTDVVVSVDETTITANLRSLLPRLEETSS